MPFDEGFLSELERRSRNVECISLVSHIIDPLGDGHLTTLRSGHHQSILSPVGSDLRYENIAKLLRELHATIVPKH